MCSRLEASNVIQQGNKLQIKFNVFNNVNNNYSFITNSSPEYVINGLAVFQVKITVGRTSNGYSSEYNNFVFIRFVKIRQDKQSMYVIKFSSNEFNLTNKTFVSDDSSWRLISENKRTQYTFDVTVHLELISTGNSFATLYDDTELTDFQLRGQDGYIRVHKAVLAAHSPVLKKMLGGKWRESTEGHVEVPGVTRQMLQHLKDYVYLHTLPDTGLDQLLLLASMYMMPDLEQQCVQKIVKTLTSKNTFEMLEFAVAHRMTTLSLAILECIKSDAVKLNEIRNHVLNEK